MKSALECLVRGSGKIFALLRFDGIDERRPLTLTSETDEGRPIPTMFFPFEAAGLPLEPGRRFVAVLPQLACAQTMSVTAAMGASEAPETSATSAQDAPAASTDASERLFALRLTPTDATWRSRANYRLKPALAAAIRDYDYARAVDQVSIMPDQCISDYDYEILRGKINIPVDYAGAVTLRLIDLEGREIPAAYTVLGDGIRTPIDRPEFVYRLLSFSLKGRRFQAPFIIDPLGEDGRSLQGFLIIDQPWLDRLRGAAWQLTANAEMDPGYNHWFAIHRLSPREWDIQRRSPQRFEPLISVIVPLFRTPLEFFYEMAESVVRQTYQNWELVLVNASPEDEALAAAADELAATVPHVRVVHLEENLGISENTNAGIAVASGEFIGFLDHDDVLEPDALYEYVRALNDDPAIDVLYCDEDKLTPERTYRQPFFKPAFEIDLLRSENYICHFLVVRASVLAACGGFDARYDGAQDHALILRISELTDRIVHIPRVLYHWRMTEVSTAADDALKPYAADAGVRAISDHLARLDIAADVKIHRFEQDFVAYGFDVDYLVAEPKPLVSIVIPTKDHIDLLARCLDSIFERSTYAPFEVVIVENNSVEPETFAYYRELEASGRPIRVVRWPDEFNFSKIVNFGVAASSGEYVLLLNNDTEVLSADWLERMVGICQRGDVGVVGAKLYYPDDTIQHAGVVALLWMGPKHLGLDMPRDYGGYFWLNGYPQDLSCVTGACLMTSRALFDELGGFDEEYAVNFNDVDFCFRVRERGQLVVYTPRVELYHYESVSRGLDVDDTEKLTRSFHEMGRLMRRWPRYYATGDPAYSSRFDNEDQYHRLNWG